MKKKYIKQQTLHSLPVCACFSSVYLCLVTSDLWGKIGSLRLDGGETGS